jgi:predicted transcriptional regulator
MPRPKPAEEPVQIAVRISPALLARLDAEAVASERSRNTVIAEALAAHIDASGGQRAAQKLAKGLAAQQERVEVAKTPALNVQFGPSKTAPGSRLRQPKR